MKHARTVEETKKPPTVLAITSIHVSPYLLQHLQHYPVAASTTAPAQNLVTASDRDNSGRQPVNRLHLERE